MTNLSQISYQTEKEVNAKSHNNSELKKTICPSKLGEISNDVELYDVECYINLS